MTFDATVTYVRTEKKKRHGLYSFLTACGIKCERRLGSVLHTEIIRFASQACSSGSVTIETYLSSFSCVVIVILCGNDELKKGKRVFLLAKIMCDFHVTN